MILKMVKKSITKFKAHSFRSGNANVVVVPKSKFDENILQKGREYEFSVSEVD